MKNGKSCEWLQTGLASRTLAPPDRHPRLGVATSPTQSLARRLQEAPRIDPQSPEAVTWRFEAYWSRPPVFDDRLHRVA